MYNQEPQLEGKREMSVVRTLGPGDLLYLQDSHGVPQLCEIIRDPLLGNSARLHRGSNPGVFDRLRRGGGPSGPIATAPPQPREISTPRAPPTPVWSEKVYKCVDGTMRWRETTVYSWGEPTVRYSRGATPGMFYDVPRKEVIVWDESNPDAVPRASSVPVPPPGLERVIRPPPRDPCSFGPPIGVGLVVDRHTVRSQLNGANGEWTGSDDLDHADRLRARREARNHAMARAGQARGPPRAPDQVERFNQMRLAAAEQARQVAQRLNDDEFVPGPVIPGVPFRWLPIDDPPPNLDPEGPGAGDGDGGEPDDDDASVASSVAPLVDPTMCDIICGTRGYYEIRSVVYRDMGGVLMPYNSATCQWAGDLYLDPHRKLAAGTCVANYTGEAGYYTYLSGRVVKVESPFAIVRNFVIEARDHLWFKSLRIELARIGSAAMNVATLGYFDPWGEHPFRFLTKVKKDIMISMKLYSFLRGHKIASGITPDNVLLLARLAFRDYPQLPVEILIETLLYFTFQRGAAISEMAATTAAISSFNAKGKRFKAYREPMTTNVVCGDLIAGVDDITDEGHYKINSVDEVKFWSGKGFTSITRLPYVQSDALHGDGVNRLKDPGDKFELMDKFGFNKGCTFVDPYPLFDTQADDRVESKSYQTVGSCFATSMMVIDGKLTREVERCFLRLSMARPGEERLRLNQQAVVRPALEAGKNLAPDVDADITRRILQQDPKYEVDVVMGPHGPLTPLQKLVRDTHLAYQSLVMDPAELAPMIANPVKAMHDYVDIIGGPKAAKRHRDIEAYRKDPSTPPQATNVIKFKPDEPQKYKFVNGKPVLKFGRATVSIEGMDWVLANPPMMYAMKHLIEKEIRITKLFVGVTLISINGVNSFSDVDLDYELWYRAVLSDTDNEQMAAVDVAMINWVSEGPMRMAAVSHGDDIHIVRSGPDGKITALEADISDNDGSYTDSLIRMEAQQVAVNIDPSACYAQLANPMQLENPANSREKILLRSTRGMLRCSGGIGTTYGNSKGSFLVILSLAMQLSTASVEECANDVGFNVTYKIVSISESCFLSTFVIFIDGPGGVQIPIRAKCLASVARNFGRFSGDLPGRSNRLVSDRWFDYVKGVVKGYVNEPDSLFMRALRIKYDGWSLGSLRSWCSSTWTPSDIDRGIIRHYYPPKDQEQGLEEYLACVRLIRDSPAFGSVVACRFIDRIMDVRYGMAPIVR